MSLKNQKTIKINGARITFRASDGWTSTDEIALQRVLFQALGKLDEQTGIWEAPARVRERIRTVARIICHTANVEGDPGFAWPGENCNDQELLAVYQDLGNLPRNGIDLCLGAIQDLDRAPGDVELSPEVTDDPKAGE